MTSKECQDGFKRFIICIQNNYLQNALVNKELKMLLETEDFIKENIL